MKLTIQGNQSVFFLCEFEVRKHPKALLGRRYVSLLCRHSQIRGHHRVRQCQLIHLTVCMSSKNLQTFSPKVHSLPWYHISQSITEANDYDNFNLHSVALLFFSPQWPALILLSAEETYHVTSLLQTGKILVWEVKCTLPITHRWRCMLSFIF